MLNIIPGQNLDDDVHIIKNDNGEDIYVFDPYNPLNVEITQEEVEGILSSYGIDVPVHNFQLYRRAFVHRSYIRRPDVENKENNIKIVPKQDCCISLYSKSNERLEFIGDGVLECITKYYLYRRFPKENEGFMTEKKIALVKNESIGRMTYEMGIHKWFIMSKNAELKQTRTNLKKLGCLFEAFIGAMFLDFNKISIKDEDKWFENVFVTGPGFQMCQIFIERIFEKHVDWIKLIQDDDNYKNILQVKIQKEFKVTPHYIEMEQHDPDAGYHMGVYLCLGQQIHNTVTSSAIDIHSFTAFKDIHQQMSVKGKIFVFLGDGIHKIKKKAEQTACEMAISNLDGF